MANLFVSITKGSFIRSVLTILTGCVFFFIPGLTMKTVMTIIGSMLLLSGLITFLLSIFRNLGNQSRFGSAQGVANILFGAIFIAAPSIIINLFMILIGVILLIMGLFQVFASTRALARSFWAWLFLLIGIVTAVSGLLLLFNPFKSAEAILPFLGILLILNGISDLFRKRKSGASTKKQYETTVQDIPYEEVS
jgi:uncharacterized membrane protein HdeD (DUF308 family)